MWTNNLKTVYAAVAVWAGVCMPFASGSALAQVKVQETKTFKYDSQGKRNPFAPLLTPDGRLLKVEEKKGNQPLTLEGIIFDPNGISYCMINGEVLSIGDEMQGFQVLKIEENKVTFVKDSQLSVMELTKEGE
jgi:hypothetical protein